MSLCVKVMIFPTVALAQTQMVLLHVEVCTTNRQRQ